MRRATTLGLGLVTAGLLVGLPQTTRSHQFDVFLSTSNVQERTAKYGVLVGKLKYIRVFVESTESENQAQDYNVVLTHGGEACGADHYLTEYTGKLKPKGAIFEFGAFYPAALVPGVKKERKGPPANVLIGKMDEQAWKFRLQPLGAAHDQDANTQNNTIEKVFKFPAGGVPKCRRLCPEHGVCNPAAPQP